MRKLLLFTWVLCAGVLAAGLEVPGRVEADDGAFVSLPVRIEAEADRLEVTVPEGFRLVSNPQARAGRQLVNLYVERGLASGVYPVTLRLWRGERTLAQARVEVFVRPRPAFELRASKLRPVVLGEPLEHRIEVANLGNVPDVYRVEARSRGMPVKVDPPELALAPGEVGTVRLELWPHTAQAVVVLVDVRSTRAPGLERRLGLATRVLPFAGAERLGGRALHYRLELAGGPSTQGWRYTVGAGLSGALSDYVSTASRAHAGTSGAGLRLGFEGDWGWLAASAGPEGYGFAGGQGDWRGELNLRNGSPSARLRWRPDPWDFSAYAAAGRQRLGAGVRWSVAPALRLEPALALDRWSAGPHYALEGKLTLAYEGLGWLGRTTANLSPTGYALSSELATRRARPFGLRAYGSYRDGRLAARLSAQRDLAGPWGWQGRVGYESGRVNWWTGVAYATPLQPWVGSLGLAGKGGLAGVRAHLGYRVPAGSLGGWVEYAPGGRWGYAVDARLREEGLELGVGYRRRDTPTLHVSLSHAWRGWRLGGSYEHDLVADRGKGRFGFSHTGRVFSFEGGLKGGETLELWFLAGLRLEGAFPTPEALIELFGGRKTGVLEGQVYADENGNGRRDDGEPAVAGARLFCGGASAESDARGRYRLEAEPGTCRLEVRGDGGRLGLARALELSFAQGTKKRMNLGLVPVAGVSGEAYLDANGNGVRDEGEHPLAGVRVRLVTPEGEVVERLTAANGRFTFDGLPPGRYRLALAAEGLPHLYAPAEPVERVLEPGPLPFVRLAAAPMKRTTRQTYRIGDVAVFVEAVPESAPPGGEVEVRVTVEGGEPSGVILEYADTRRELASTDGRHWTGYLRVPRDRRGYLPFRVHARFEAGEAVEEGVVRVRPGALARLTLEPALVDPGDRVRATARFQLAVGAAELRVGERVYPLERADRWTWTAELAAPREPGRYKVELWADGRRYAQTNLRVLEP